MKQKRPNTALAALAALGLLIVACSSDEEATPAPTAEPTATATAEATATAGATATAAEAAEAVTTTTASAAFGDPVPAPALDGLLNPDRSAFDVTSLQGRPTLVFFGYTHCPDVCPATIGELFGVFEEEPDAQAVFVSVDPERDTPEFLEEWTTYLPENLHAVTGTPGAIRRAADGWGVKYARVETTSTAGYTMSHTADLYLLDEDGQLLTTYPFGTTSAEIVEDLRALAAA
ncbi:MAG: SCO family protein [Candidatus Limnocylindrales bacterium]